jgi:hypothetical protein
MGAVTEAYLAEVDVAVESASAAGDVGGDGKRRALPPVAHAVVRREDLPEMPAEVIEGVLLETHKMLLTGPSKANKTWCLINLAESVATGGWWIGMRCAKRRVLYIDLETDPRTLERRVSTVAYARGSDPGEVADGLFLWPLRGQSLGLSEISAELLSRYRAGDFGMVIIDPAYMVQDGDENNVRDIRDFFAELDRLCVGLACTVVISHHHSKGAQGLKSAIDRGSGSGVFGRAPDAVVDLTELVLDDSTLEAARQSHRLAECRSLTGWRMSFTLREFAPRPPMDVWFRFPLHERDDTGLLAECKPNYGGLTEARRVKLEAENDGKVAALDAACERLMGAGGFCYRDDVAAELGWSQPTVKRWIDRSARFMRSIDQQTMRATVVRRPGVGGVGDDGGDGERGGEGGAGSGERDGADFEDGGGQRELPL